MEQERLKRRILEDIQRQLVELLAERRIDGQLALNHQHAVLTVGSDVRRAELSDLPSRWRQLTPNERRAQLQPLVEKLARAQAGRRRTGRAPVALLSIAVVTLGLGGAIVREILQTRRSAAGPDAWALDEQARQDRERRVCEATRSRIMRGGTAGPTDATGWVVELFLIDEPGPRDGGSSPSLDEFFLDVGLPTMQVRATSHDALGDRAEAKVELLERIDGSLRERRFLLQGDHVRSYFDEGGRRAWMQFASALFEHTRARHGALVARCSHQTSHHVGSWFGGRSVAAAAAALLHFAGAFSETPVFSQQYLPEQDGARPELRLLRLFEQRTTNVERTQLAMWLSRDQATLSGREGEAIMIRFPYRDSNRASRSSLRVARRLELATSR